MFLRVVSAKLVPTFLISFILMSVAVSLLFPMPSLPHTCIYLVKLIPRPNGRRDQLPLGLFPRQKIRLTARLQDFFRMSTIANPRSSGVMVAASLIIRKFPPYAVSMALYGNHRLRMLQNKTVQPNGATAPSLRQPGLSYCTLASLTHTGPRPCKP